jgi:hypothetical protein
MLEECRVFYANLLLKTFHILLSPKGIKAPSALQTIRKKILEILNSLYDLLPEDPYREQIRKVRSIGEGVSLEEKREIFQALSKEVGGVQGGYGGHWFTCPNGHIFVIGECGGAMQESVCIECGATVGGSSHRLATGNAVADEFLREIGVVPR